MARKFAKKALVFAKEVTYGIDAIGAAETSVAVLGREVKITPLAGENTALEYDDGNLGNSAEIETETYVSLEFGVDWAGSGTAITPASYRTLLAACLRKTTVKADSVEQAIDEDGTDSITFYFYMDGTLHALVGARGSFKLEAKAKEFPKIMFTFTGLFVPVISAVLPATDFSAWQTPLKVGAANSSCTLGGNAIKLISFEYDQANDVIHQEYVGHEEVLITDYAPSGKLVFEAASLISFDPFAANTQVMTFELSHGVATNLVQWKTAQLQLGRAEYGDQDGTLTYELPIRPLSNVDLLINK
ncbi:hypothetical protein CXF86_19855 [Shewanella sp. GutCb]|uniref:hypothetical protein n=1 Tax=Shewanella sp. GutCb TaxID=2058315 RepID=UPI000C7D8812|nr:hypothetical protein [Shewanella sp. GutCb]PKG73022.1 hypothetical protein CXF86_19855 [Shewanella sp. GutCb]